MAKKRFYYAETDRFTGDNPRDFTAGFANTKEPIAFRTRAARDEWLSETMLLTARPLSREEAKKGAFAIYGGHRGCRIYGEGGHLILVPASWL